MREIIFRGKRLINCAWVEGLLERSLLSDKLVIHTPPKNPDDPDDHGLCRTIFPETIGEYTGLEDKNGKRVFEGDVVILTFSNSKCYGEVVFHNGGFCVNTLDTFISLQKCPAYEFELIGNVHDNPELLNTNEERDARE